MYKRKKKWPWIVLIVVFSVVLVLDIVCWALSGNSSSGFGGGRFGRSGDGEMPDISQFKDGEMPDMSQFKDGERPSFPGKNKGDGESSDTDDSKGDKVVTADGDLVESGDKNAASDSDGSSRKRPSDMPSGKSSFLNKLKNFYLPVMIGCIVFIIFGLIMLIRAVKLNKKNSGNGDDGGDFPGGGNGGNGNGGDFPGGNGGGNGGNGGYDGSGKGESNENGLPGIIQSSAASADSDDQKKKRKTGPVVAVILSVVVVATVVALTILSNRKEADKSGVKAEETVKEASLTEGSITSVVTAGGSVTAKEEDATLPSGIEIAAYKVSEGDAVEAGDVIAEVDKTSVIATIKDVQDTIGELDGELEEISDEASEKMSASAAGRVKKINAASGDSVVDVVREEQALMLISLDGKMAVDLETEKSLSIGTSVSVMVGEDSVTGRVEAVRENGVTVTIDDEYGACGEQATVSDDSSEIGSGELYINNMLSVTGYEGIVDEIKVEEGDEVSKGDTILTLTEGAYSARYENLLKQRNKLEEQMKQLFELYQTGEIKAEKTGEIVKENLTAGEVTFYGKDVAAEQMSNSPTGEDDSSYVNYAVLITGIKDDELQVKMSAAPLGDIDLTTVGLVNKKLCVNAGTVSKTDIGFVYGYNGTEWVAQTVADIAKGDVVIATFDTAGNLIWIVRNAATAQTDPTFDPTKDPTGDPTKDPTSDPTKDPTKDSTKDPTKEPTDSKDGKKTDTKDDNTDDKKKDTKDGEKTDSTEDPSGKSDDPSGKPDDPTVQPSTEQTTEEGSGDRPSRDGSGGYSGAGQGGGFSGNSGGSTGSSSAFPTDGTDTLNVTEEEEAEKIYAVEEVSVYSIASKTRVEISLTVDELDITHIAVGQTCEVTFDALSGRSFEGKVEEIDLSGENGGGNTKYTVLVTLEREDEMLSGMNTHITFVSGTKEGVQMLPESALVEKDGKVYVYTSYDKEKDELGGLQEVETGAADGDNVEILSGITDGDKVYYKYADSLSYTFINN